VVTVFIITVEGWAKRKERGYGIIGRICQEDYRIIIKLIENEENNIEANIGQIDNEATIEKVKEKFIEPFGKI